eukprot:9473375-Pyramimonas_sp.AAC.1
MAVASWPARTKPEFTMVNNCTTTHKEMPLMTSALLSPTVGSATSRNHFSSTDADDKKTEALPEGLPSEHNFLASGYAKGHCHP